MVFGGGCGSVFGYVEDVFVHRGKSYLGVACNMVAYVVAYCREVADTFASEEANTSVSNVGGYFLEILSVLCFCYFHELHHPPLQLQVFLGCVFRQRLSFEFVVSVHLKFCLE